MSSHRDHTRGDTRRAHPPSELRTLQPVVPPSCRSSGTQAEIADRFLVEAELWPGAGICPLVAIHRQRCPARMGASKFRGQAVAVLRADSEVPAVPQEL